MLIQLKENEAKGFIVRKSIYQSAGFCLTRKMNFTPYVDKGGGAGVLGVGGGEGAGVLGIGGGRGPEVLGEGGGVGRVSGTNMTSREEGEIIALVLLEMFLSFTGRYCERYWSFTCRYWSFKGRYCERC